MANQALRTNGEREAKLFDLLVRETNTQSEFSLFAFEQLQAHMDNNGNQLQIFFWLQAFLAPAANVSKLLWPISTKPVVTERREKLRSVLNVSDNSVLKNRALRNSFEHFDERLEEWAESSQRMNFVDMNIMRAGSIRGIDESDYHRNFDPNTLKLTFRGEEFDISQAYKELRDIHKNAKSYLSF